MIDFLSSDILATQSNREQPQTSPTPTASTSMSTSTILYQGALSAGKWSDAEELILKQATRSFLDGTLADCAEGEAFTTYIAAYINCPVSRILNKFLDKPVLKARYSASSEGFEENWDALDLEDFSSWHDIVPALDFDSLLQMEQDRFLEYSANTAQGLDAFDALIERDCEFNRRVQKMAETTAPRRKRKSRSTPMSARFKSCFGPSTASSSGDDLSSCPSSPSSETSTPRCQRPRYGSFMFESDAVTVSF